MALKRYENWPILLDEYLRSCKKEKFKYGKHDCCLFVCKGIEVMTGVDTSKGFKYKGRKQADKLIVKGLKVLIEKETTKHNMPEVPTYFAQRGDVCLLNTVEGWTLGLVALNGRQILAPGLTSLISYELKDAEKAWRVG